MKKFESKEALALYHQKWASTIDPLCKAMSGMNNSDVSGLDKTGVVASEAYELARQALRKIVMAAYAIDLDKFDSVFCSADFAQDLFDFLAEKCVVKHTPFAGLFASKPPAEVLTVDISPGEDPQGPPKRRLRMVNFAEFARWAYDCDTVWSQLHHDVQHKAPDTSELEFFRLVAARLTHKNAILLEELTRKSHPMVIMTTDGVSKQKVLSVIDSVIREDLSGLCHGALLRVKSAVENMENSLSWHPTEQD